MRFFLVILTAVCLPAYGAEKPVREKLLNTTVTGLNSHMVLAERLTIPAHFTAPFHHHPVEEFLYIIEGDAIVRFKNGEDIPVQAGDLYVIPARQVHTAVTLDKSVTALIYRMHPKGEPVTIPFKE